jgi:hypothetical protein
MISVLFFTGCKKNQPIMDQPAEDGKYHYRNIDLEFSLVLSPQFEYYQTQRKEADNYIDIEFFVPTNDLTYPQEVASYAKPIVVRVFEEKAWEKNANKDMNMIIYKKVGEKKDKVYTIRFWENLPTDWVDRWDDEIQKSILDSFKLN